MFGITNENCRKYLRLNKRESNKHRLTDTEDATRVESETSIKKNFCTISANVFLPFFGAIVVFLKFVVPNLTLTPYIVARTMDLDFFSSFFWVIKI